MKLLTTYIGRFRIISFLEGMSLLILLLIAMPIKYGLGNEMPVRIVGAAHGGLFILFLLYAMHVAIAEKWKVTGNLWKVMASSIIPFGFLYVDKKILKPIYEEEFVVLMPKDHAWTKLESIETDQLSTDNLLLLGKGHCFSEQVLEACPLVTASSLDDGRTVVNGSSLETIRYMVASGLGVTVLPKSAVTNINHDMLEVRPFSAPAPKRTVALAWRASFPRPKAIEAVSQSIRDACKHLNL